MVNAPPTAPAEPEKCLVLGSPGNTRACLTVIRSLGRKGLTVHLAMPEGDTGMVLASCFLSKVHQLPVYGADPDAWLQHLLDLVRAEDFQAVFPTSDASIIPFQENRPSLGDLASRFTLLNKKAHEVAINKQRSRELAISLGCPVAAGRTISAASEALSFAAQHGYPLVAKPLSSFTSWNLSSKREVTKLCRDQDIRDLFEASSQPYLIEQFFRGAGCGVEFLADRGEIRAAFQHDRVHEPLHGGGSSYRKAVPLHEEMLAASRKLIHALDYTGVGMVEFKQNRDTGKFVFIEINGRFWGSLPLAVAAGADFPAWLYDAHVKGRTRFPQSYKVGTYSRNLVLDAIWFMRNLKADKSDPTLMTRPLHQILGEIRHLFGGKEHWDSWAWDDPAPFFSEIWHLTSGAWQTKVVYPLKSRWAGRAGERERERTRFAKAVKSKPEVLIVCRGNICRSPFAAHRLRERFPMWQIRQAGTYPVAGRSSPETAQAAAKQLGVDLSSHRSTVLSPSMMQDAGAVLVFDWKNLRELTQRYPKEADKIFLFGQLGTGAPVIQDPFGKKLGTFLDTYRQIDHAANRPCQKKSVRVSE